MLRQKPVMKSLVALVLVFLFILAGSSVTVYASQSSLPGQPLYAVKSWSEDVRLAMTSSPNAKLSLTLDYTNRRVDEISNLSADGKAVNDQTADRFQRELEDALQLAAQLDDPQMQHALGEIKKHAESQGLTLEELISKLPPQAKTAVVKLQERLNEQVQLSNIGETDPKKYRSQVHERQKNLQRTNHATDVNQSQSTPDEISITPIPKQDSNHNGDEKSQPSEVPGHGGPGNDQGQSTPGKGNHGQNPTHTPKP
jgi:membrane-associated HD superfamily phosphohydrolase